MKKIITLLVMLSLVLSVNAQKRKSSSQKKSTTTQTVSNALPVTMPTTQQELLDLLVGKWESNEKVQGKTLKCTMEFDNQGNYTSVSRCYASDRKGSINFDIYTEGRFRISSDKKFTIYPDMDASELRYVSSKGWSKAEIADFKGLTPYEMGLDPSITTFTFVSITNNIITVEQYNTEKESTSKVTFKKLQ